MKGQKWIAYDGDTRRRDAALAQMREHAESPRFADLTVGGITFYFYGWNRPRELAAAAAALRLPEALLHLGTWLFEGFPESEESFRAEVLRMIELLETFTVGKDLRWAIEEICLDILDHELGIDAFVNTTELAAIRAELKLILTNDGHQSQVLAELRDRVEAERRIISDLIPTQWQSVGRVDTTVYEGLRAAETMLTMTELPRDMTGLFRAAERSVFGAFGHNVTDSHARMVWLRTVFEKSVG